MKNWSTLKFLAQEMQLWDDWGMSRGPPGRLAWMTARAAELFSLNFIEK